MARSGPELQLFTAESNGLLPPALKQPPIFERRRSFRDIQGVISKINPEVVKSVIANVSSSVPSTPKDVQRSFPPPLLLCDPTLNLSSGYEGNAETGLMTIFYNGKVAVFDVSSQKAQDILKFAEGGLPKSAESSDSNSYDRQNLLETLNGDLPLARRKSLQRFLEKRKERLTMVIPYDSSTNYYSYSGPTASGSTPKY